MHPVFYVSRLKKYVQGGGDGLDLGAGPGPVMIDAHKEYEVDCILRERGSGTRRRFLVGFRGWDDSEA